MVTLADYLARTFSRVRDQPDPERAARTLARATTIVGLMLEDLGEHRGGWSRVSGALVLAGRTGWTLVELAAPRSLGNVLFHHWIAIAWLVAVVMLTLGFGFGVTGLVSVGLRAIAVVAVMHLVTDLLNRWMRRARLGPAWMVLLVALASTIAMAAWMARIDREIFAAGGTLRRASVSAGRIVTHADAQALLGSADNFERMQRSLQIDLVFIASYVVLIFAAGVVLRTPKQLAGIAVGLATIDLLENYQVLHALDQTALTPFIWYLKIGAAVFLIVAVGWAVSRRALRTA